jgi:DNA repair protein RecO (recombination protein O)
MDAETERRQRLYRVAAIVLKRRDQGEADRLLTVFARERGKVTLIAKGVRRTASRKAGHIEPFTHVDLLVARGKSLDIITQAEMVDAHRHLREDLWRSSWAYYVVELADAFAQDEDPNQLLFDLLLDTLDRLDRGAADQRGTDPLLVVRYYEVHLLSLVGYQPQLFRCVQCGELLKPEVNFLSLARGGCLCPTHGANHPETLALPLPVLKVLRFLQSRGWDEVAALQITPATMNQVEAVLKRYIVFHLERTVRSAAFLDRLRATLAQAEQPAAGSHRSLGEQTEGREETTAK